MKPPAAVLVVVGFIFVLFWNQQQISVSCLSIFMHNRDAFEHGITNEPFTLSITIDPIDKLTVNDVEKSKICMMVHFVFFLIQCF
jgi:hypothetical protein